MLRNRAPHRFARGSGPAGLNAVDQQLLSRKRKEWRAEWEAERAREEAEEYAGMDEQLDDFLEGIRERRLANMSPRARAAWDEAARIEAEDQEQGYSPWNDPEHPHYVKPKAERTLEDLTRPPEGFVPAPAEEVVVEDSGPRVRTLKDDGWD